MTETDRTIPRTEKTLFEIRHVSKSFRDGNRGVVHAVNDLSFDIYEGETLGLVGESGCGKSTVGNLLVHLLDPDEGSIRFRGEELAGKKEKDFRKFRRDIQMIFQDPYSSINPKKKIGWLLEEALAIHEKGLDRTERKKRAGEMLKVVGLDESYQNRYPRQLSGGQRQRVSIALALILKPAFLAADEPVSALDVSVQAQILNLMRKLQKEYALTCLFISHDLNVVSYLSDRIGVMYLGSLVEIGTQAQIWENPKHPYTRALFENARGKGMVLKGEVPSPSELPSGCPFRTRCPFCEKRCEKEKPTLREIEPGRMAACHLVFADTSR